MKTLLILGAGGYGKTIADVAEQIGGYDCIAFLDDGKTGDDIWGTCGQFSEFAKESIHMYPAFGNNTVRLQWLRQLREAGIPVPTLVHPRAYVSPKAKLGMGTVVLPMAVVNTGVTAGDGCIFNIGALADHDSIFGDGVHLAPGAIVKADNRIPEGMKIDSGVVIENRTYPL